MSKGWVGSLAGEEVEEVLAGEEVEGVLAGKELEEALAGEAVTKLVALEAMVERLTSLKTGEERKKIVVGRQMVVPVPVMQRHSLVRSLFVWTEVALGC